MNDFDSDRTTDTSWWHKNKAINQIKKTILCYYKINWYVCMIGTANGWWRWTSTSVACVLSEGKDKPIFSNTLNSIYWSLHIWKKSEHAGELWPLTQKSLLPQKKKKRQIILSFIFFAASPSGAEKLFLNYSWHLFDLTCSVSVHLQLKLCRLPQRSTEKNSMT